MTGVRKARVTVAALCLLAFVVAAPLAGGAHSLPARPQEQPDTDNTVTRIQVHPNGSAVWTVRVRTRLATDDDVAEFEAFRDRFRSNTSRYLDPFRDRIRRVVAAAGNETGREMRATDFAASTSIQEVPRRWGVVTYRFAWTNFALQRNGTLAAGDVFQGGFFLAENDSLELAAPPGYEVASVEPAPDDREPGLVAWQGREDFGDGRPSAVFAPANDSTDGATPTEAPTSPATTATGADRTASPTPDESAETGGSPAQTDSPSTPGGSGDRALLVLGALVLGVGAVAYTLWSHRGGDADLGSDESTASGDAPPAASAGAAAGGGEILTDAERVQRLLDANGGRMKQAEIAEALDWSASKTSRVVGDLVEEGAVEKLQLGRENVIDLVDDE